MTPITESDAPHITRCFRCDGNRFCDVVGPFYDQCLLSVGSRVQHVVGACWAERSDHPEEPSRFVCSRCAHRTLAYDGGLGPESKIWRLHCPFDGIPLGDGRGHLLFGTDGKLLRRFEKPPSRHDFEKSIDMMRKLQEPSRPPLLIAAADSFRRGDYAKALALANRVCELEPDDRLAWTICYRCFERMGLRSITIPPDFGSIKDEVNRLNKEIEEAVANQDYEKAAPLLNLADNLYKRGNARREVSRGSERRIPDGP